MLCRFLPGLFFAAFISFGSEKPLVLSDFDKTLPAQKWMKSGNVLLKLLDTTGTDIKEISANGLSITFEDTRSFVYSPSGIFTRDFKKYDHLSFWIYLENETKAEFEFQIMDKNNSSRFWRKVSVAHNGWKKILIPLKWLRWGGSKSPSWNDVSRVAIHPREKCHFAIDQIQFEDLQENSSFIVENPGEITQKLAEPENIQTYGKNFFIISESPHIDVKTLGEHIEKILLDITEKVPTLAREENEARPFLMILKDGKGFKKALSKYGELHFSKVPGTELSGYSMMNSAFSSYSEKYGTMRPVYLHEFMHAVLATQGRILKSHNWIHEGFANYFQMKYQPQEGLGKIILNSLNQEDLSAHLLQLTEKDEVQFKDYIYVLMIAETLWESDKYSAKIAGFFEYVENSGDTNLKNILQKVYGKTFDQFFEDIKAFLNKKYG